MNSTALPPHRTLRRRWRYLALASGLVVGTAALLWFLVNHTAWAGPMFANGLRSVIGTNGVAKLEDFTYGLQDRYNRWHHRGEKPQARWTVPLAASNGETSSAPSVIAAGETQAFSRPDVGPVHQKWSAPGDGQWVPMVLPREPKGPRLMLKTLLHPDPNRSWAELFVVAIDLHQIRLHAVPGTREPRDENTPPGLSRPGRVPEQDLPYLLAAFNGGFMAEHGHYGMRVDGVTFLPPKDTACTIASFPDNSLEIGSWSHLKDSQNRMQWFRQAPACMYENDTMHLGLRSPETRAWGATLDGATVIRRSAIGLDASRSVLFVAIGNSVTARAIAEGMHHVGAVDVAQLDVNFSYPKFLIYSQKPSGALDAAPLAEGFEYSHDEYVGHGSLRDFFYITRRPETMPKELAEPIANVDPSQIAQLSRAASSAHTAKKTTLPPATSASAAPLPMGSAAPAASN